MKFKTNRLRTVFFAVMLATAAITGLSCASATQERKTVVQPADLPAPIRAALKKAFAEGEIVAVEKEVEGEDPGQYDVDMRSEGKLYEVEISPQGEIIEVQEKSSAKETSNSKGKKWTDSFHQEDCTLATTGKNRYFSLQPGHQLVLQNKNEKVVITVLDETMTVAGVETRIVEEREEVNGKLKEISRNYFAICKEHGDVFYFGEEVNDYEDGKIVGHAGGWRADDQGAKVGLIMPGTILLGARYYQEMAPDAMDRAEIIDDNVTMKTPAGTFKNCLRVEETSAVETEEKGYKAYAPEIGLIQDEDLLLTEYKEGK